MPNFFVTLHAFHCHTWTFLHPQTHPYSIGMAQWNDQGDPSMLAPGPHFLAGLTPRVLSVPRLGWGVGLILRKATEDF